MSFCFHECLFLETVELMRERIDELEALSEEDVKSSINILKFSHLGQ